MSDEPSADTLPPSAPAPSRPLVRLSVLAGILVALPCLSACSAQTTSSSTPTTTTPTTAAVPPTTTAVTVQQGSAAEVSACGADAKSLEVALQAYMAVQGAYPAPPSAWSAASYDGNFAPLTSSQSGIGPFLPRAPATTSYVIEYDAAGHVWVAPPGSYGASYNPGQSFDTNPGICLAAVR
jgi:hypothetical protein